MQFKLELQFNRWGESPAYIYMKYYVYIHYEKLTGIVFYVGKGSGNRCNSKYSRPKDWYTQATKGYEIKKLHEELSEKAALELENFYILNPPGNWKLVNVHQNAKHNYSEINWLDHFYYDAKSPSGLCHTGNFKGKCGSVAGSQKFYPNGKPQEWVIRVGTKSYRAHCVIATMLGWDFNGKVVNHIDCNPHNNNKDNLELCTQEENMQRTWKHKECYANPEISDLCITEEQHVKVDNEVTYTTTYAKVRVTVHGKRKNKRFSYSKYGKDQAWNLARQYRDKLLKERLI